jgi:hypothetical protein
MNKTWVILISVAEYDDVSNNLPYVHNDNECIKQGLTNGLLIPNNQIIVCGKNDYVKYSDFEKVIALCAQKIMRSDRVIVYFSGHGGGAPFSLRFSDSYKEFSCFCDEIDKLQAYAKILIIDACFSGNAEIPESSAKAPSQNLLDYVRSGYAIFTSSNSGTSSTRHPEHDVSLYTYCFSEALCHTRTEHGNISLTDVAKQAARNVDYMANTHGLALQHPVFKCHIPGDVLFQIAEEQIIENNVYSSSHEHYDVCATGILHSSEMRYSVFAIAKDDISDEIIANYTMQIANEVRPLRKFKNKEQQLQFWGRSTTVVFVYWGKNREDVIRRNWIYRSIWASPSSNRGNWYRVGKDSKIVLDIWIQVVPQYATLEKTYRDDVVSNDELIQLTRNVANSLLQAARNVVEYFEEYDNGEIPEYAFIQASQKHFNVIQDCYWRMCNLPVPSVDLKEWADCYDCLAASIDDMQRFYTAKVFLDRAESNRKACMQERVKRYRDDLQHLAKIEADLRETGIIPMS